MVGPYVHKSIRGEAKNLVAENLYFDGMYPLQTENSKQYPIYNVVYRNIYAPNGCVSFMPNHNIENVYIENITCDLFRLHNLRNNRYGLKNATVNKVTLQNLSLNLRYSNDDNIILRNIKQTSKPRNNVYIKTEGSAYVSGNVTFNNCRFSSLSEEKRGMIFGKGTQNFYDSEWSFSVNAYTHNSFEDKIFSYQLFENCNFIKK